VINILQEKAWRKTGLTAVSTSEQNSRSYVSESNPRLLSPTRTEAFVVDDSIMAGTKTVAICVRETKARLHNARKQKQKHSL
jgi:hypothetical protein